MRIDPFGTRAEQALSETVERHQVALVVLHRFEPFDRRSYGQTPPPPQSEKSDAHNNDGDTNRREIQDTKGGVALVA